MTIKTQHQPNFTKLERPIVGKCHTRAAKIRRRCLIITKIMHENRPQSERYVGKEVANLDNSNILGVTSDESCTVYENLEEKILEIRPRDSNKFGISRNNLIVIQKKIRSKDSQIKLQKTIIKKL